MHRFPELRGLGLDDRLLGGDPGQLVLGPRHFRLGVGERLGGGIGLLARLQDLAAARCAAPLILIGRLCDCLTHPAERRGRHRGEQRAEGEHRGKHGHEGATQGHDGP